MRESLTKACTQTPSSTLSLHVQSNILICLRFSNQIRKNDIQINTSPKPPTMPSFFTPRSKITVTHLHHRRRVRNRLAPDFSVDRESSPLKPKSRTVAQSFFPESSFGSQRGLRVLQHRGRGNLVPRARIGLGFHQFPLGLRSFSLSASHSQCISCFFVIFLFCWGFSRPLFLSDSKGEEEIYIHWISYTTT